MYSVHNTYMYIYYTFIIYCVYIYIERECACRLIDCFIKEMTYTLD